MANRKITELTQISEIAAGDLINIVDISEVVNNKSKSASIQQLDNRYLAFEPTATPYGEMYITSNANPVGITTQLAYELVDDFVEGETNLVAFNASTLVPAAAGDYHLSVSVAATKAVTPGQENYQFTVFKNGIETRYSAVRDFSSAQTGSVMITGIIPLAVDDILDLRVRNINDVDDITIIACNFNINGI